jgi:oligoribonuclease (3'-5' exoribonuclease)
MFFVILYISGPDIVIHHNQDILDKMNDWSRQQHTKSGLIQLIQQSQISLYDAETTIIDFLKQYCTIGSEILAGNSVFVDRWQVLSDFKYRACQNYKPPPLCHRFFSMKKNSWIKCK